MGVTSWINLYRSGDYVGRSVWLDDWFGVKKKEARKDGNTCADCEYFARCRPIVSNFVLALVRTPITGTARRQMCGRTPGSTGRRLKRISVA